MTHPSIIEAVRPHLPTIDAAEARLADERDKATKLEQRLAEAHQARRGARAELDQALHRGEDAALEAFTGDAPIDQLPPSTAEEIERRLATLEQNIATIEDLQGKQTERIADATKAVKQARKAALVAAQDAAGARLVAALASISDELATFVQIRAAFAFPGDERLPEVLRAQRVGISSSAFDKSYDAHVAGPARASAVVRFGELVQVETDPNTLDRLLAAARPNPKSKAA